MRPQFQTAGTLQENSFYVRRPADIELPKALEFGEFCYILAPRQIGKSSLRVRTARNLRERGIRCATIDLTGIGTELKEEQWYLGLAQQIVDSLPLTLDPEIFWKQHSALSPVQRWLQFLRNEILTRVRETVVVFVDEIDVMLSLPFSRDDFFASIRALHNKRADDLHYNRLTFCLIGVAKPADLVRNSARTPFNIGRGILLEDFTQREAREFLPGLQSFTWNSEAMLREIYEWTNGHPYMMQRICKAVTEQEVGLIINEKELVNRLVRELFLKRGRTEDANLMYADQRFKKNRSSLAVSAPIPRQLRRSEDRLQALTASMLALYRKLLEDERIRADKDDAIQMELRLTGMVALRQSENGAFLKIRNRIFAQVFDLSWVKEKESERLLTDPLERWISSGRQDDYALQGTALEDANFWATDRNDLTQEEREFLHASERLQKRKQRRKQFLLFGLIAFLCIGLVVVFWLHQKEKEARYLADEAKEQAIKYLMEAESKGLEAVALAQAEKDANNRLALEKQKADSMVIAEKKAREQSELAVLTEKSVRASNFASEPGQEIKALHLSISAVGESMIKQLPLPAETFAGLAASVTAAYYSMPLGGKAFFTAFSSDGKLIVSANDGDRVRVWEAKTTKAIAELRGHSADVLCATFSPDTKKVMTIDCDARIRVFEMNQGKLLQSQRIHPAGIIHADFSPDARYVVALDRNRRALLGDLSSTHSATNISPSFEKVISLSFVDGGRSLALAGENGCIEFWDLTNKTRRTPEPLKYYAGVDTSLEFSPEGRYLLGAKKDGTVMLLDTTDKLAMTLRGHTGPVVSASFSRDGNYLLTASQDGSARLWEVASGQMISLLQAYFSPLRHGTLSPDGQRALTIDKDGVTRRWLLSKDISDIELDGNGTSFIFVTYLQDATHFLTVTPYGALKLWNLQSREGELLRDAQQQRIMHTDYSANRKLLLIVFESGGAEIIDLDDKDEKFQLTNTHFATFSLDGSRLLSIGLDGVVHLWDSNSGELLSKLTTNFGKMEAAALSREGKFAIVIGSDHSAGLWHVERKEFYKLPTQEKISTSLVLAPDGQRFVITMYDGKAQFWNTATLKLSQKLMSHHDVILKAVFSPVDGKRLVTISRGDSPNLSNGETGEWIASLKGHTNWVEDVLFSPNGQLIATTSWDGTAKLWEANEGRLLTTFYGHTAKISAAAFSPDGAHLLTAGDDGMLKIYPTTIAGLLKLACELMGNQADFESVRSYCELCAE